MDWLDKKIWMSPQWLFLGHTEAGEALHDSWSFQGTAWLWSMTALVGPSRPSRPPHPPSLLLTWLPFLGPWGSPPVGTFQKVSWVLLPALTGHVKLQDRMVREVSFLAHGVGTRCLCHVKQVPGPPIKGLWCPAGLRPPPL